MNKIAFNHYSALFASLIAFSVILFWGMVWTQSINKSIIDQHQFALSGISRTQASVLERRLSSAFTSAQILAYEVEQNNGDIGKFESYASKLIESIGGIENLQLAPDGIISNIYPLTGNEAAIGLDILSSIPFQKEASLSVENRRMFVIGPVDLVQGGVAVISRAPIFIYKDTQKELFWGFASAVIYLDNLLDATQLKQLVNEGYEYQLSRFHDASNAAIVLSSSPTPLSDIRVSTDLILPVGTWTLTMSHTLNMSLEEKTLIGYSASLIVALVIAFSLFAVLNQPLKLRALVKEKTAELQDLAYKDPLTGLLNRRFLQDTLPSLLHQNQKRKRISAFIYFDLDNFKRINDTIGHDVGDQVLIIVANRLNQLKNSSDLIVRLGGDEFGIFLGNISNQEEAKSRANEILTHIRNPITLENKEYLLSTSLGIAMVPTHGHNLVTIMQNADMALYQAKLLGKNQYSFYTKHMRTTTYHQIEAEEDFNRALLNNEFEMYYQPQFDLHNNQVFAAEALIRWNHPEKGLVFPNDFIPMAEKTRKIVPLGYWIIESSIAYLAQRKQAGHPNILLHINLASDQLSDPECVPKIQDLLLKYNVPAESIGFEITETSILEDIPLARSILQIFRDMGICIAIDDFGTGYSSLSQLKNLPVDLLKIDRSFVMDLEQDPDDRKIVEAIIAMAHKLNIKVIAEGIETRAQWNMLASFQCDYGQGYYVSKAITASEFNNGITISHANS